MTTLSLTTMENGPSEAAPCWHTKRPLTTSSGTSREGLGVKPTRICSVADCGATHYGKGYCQKHYLRVRATGDPHTVRTGHRFTEADPVERLWVRSEWHGTCLIYTEGHESKSGHVQMGYLGGYQGVHRVAWAVVHGPIPDGRVVRHKCDTPRCINVEHLELGTVADNNQDRDSRGRHVPLPGVSNGFARLNVEQVQSIRRRLATGESTYTIARSLDVSQATIWNISAGRTWKHVA